MKFDVRSELIEATDPQMDRGRVTKNPFVEKKFHFWNRTSINESPPEIAPVHKYPEKSPFSFQLQSFPAQAQSHARPAAAPSI